MICLDVAKSLFYATAYRGYIFLLLKLECRVVRKRKSTNCQYYQNINCPLLPTTVQKSKQIYEKEFDNYQ